MENQITVNKALEITINILNGINVPISLMEQIGLPISRAVHNIEQCVEALNRADAEQQKTEEEPEIDVEVVPMTQEEIEREMAKDGNDHAE